MRIGAFLITIFVTLGTWAQQPSQSAPAASQLVAGDSTQSEQTVAKRENLVATEPNTLMSEEKIPCGARIYLAPMANGFDNYVIAGLQQKKVPVVVAADRTKAEYEITGVAETDRAGWAKMLFLGSQQSNETASV